MENETASEPLAGIVTGTFAPEMLNPEVVALTDEMVQERKMSEFVTVSVSCSDPPPLVVYPVNVCPFVPQALSLETMLIAVTSTTTVFAPPLFVPVLLFPRNQRAATITTTTMTSTITNAMIIVVRLFFGGGGGGAATKIGWTGVGGGGACAGGIDATSAAPHLEQNVAPA
jgi:hypothetical protein